MKLVILFVLFISWTLIHAQVSPNDPVYCADEYPDGPPEICPAIYAPVCGTVNVVCVTAPCPPVQETFASGCNACANGNVEYYIQGECPDDRSDGEWNDEEEWICEAGEGEGECWGEEENCWAWWEEDATDGDDDGGVDVIPVDTDDDGGDDDFIIVTDGETVH